MHLCPLGVTFDHRAFGGHRPKHTTIAASLDCFSSLSTSCHGDSPTRTHLPWGVSTAGFVTWAGARVSPHPWPLLLKSPRPLHVTLCLTTGGHLVPCLSRQPCFPRTVPMANDQPKALRSQPRARTLCSHPGPGPKPIFGKSSVCTHGTPQGALTHSANCSCTISSIQQLHYRFKRGTTPPPMPL